MLIVPTTQPEAIEQYSIRVVDSWKLGRKGVDDGVLLLVAKDDRTVRIEVGYGLEGVIPDAIANRVMDEFILPRFRDGDFAGGIPLLEEAAAADPHNGPLALRLARAAAEAGGTAPAALNAANEVAVAAFLEGRLGFLEIPRVIEAVLERHANQAVTALADVLGADRWARDLAESMLARAAMAGS